MQLRPYSIYSSWLKTSSLLVCELACLVTLTALTACSPPFDWRISKSQSYGDTYSLEYPGKPLAAKRNVVLSGNAVELTLHGVQTEGAQFAWGHTPAMDAAHAQQLARALAESFASNWVKSNGLPSALATAESAFTPVKVANTLGAFDFNAVHAGRLVQARFIWTAHGAYELLAVGDVKALPIEVAEQFTRSIRFEP
jgi:hypothetical protein